MILRKAEYDKRLARCDREITSVPGVVSETDAASRRAVCKQAATLYMVRSERWLLVGGAGVLGLVVGGIGGYLFGRGGG